MYIFYIAKFQAKSWQMDTETIRFINGTKRRNAGDPFRACSDVNSELYKLPAEICSKKRNIN
jgi:hypothetical protein